MSTNVCKILVHTPEPESGSAKYVAEFTIALAHRSAHVELFCPANFTYVAEVKAVGATVTLAPPRDTSDDSLLKRILRNIVYLHRSLKIHGRLIHAGYIVHFQFPIHLPLGFAYYLQVKAKRASVVLTAHDPLPHRWRFPQSLRWMERFMLGYSYRICSLIFVHNRAGKEILTQQFHIPAHKICITPHGLNCNPTAVDAFPGFEEFKLLAFGAIRENKGLHLVIQAVNQLQRSNEIPVRLTIAGALNTQAERKYWEYCQNLMKAAPSGFNCKIDFIPDEAIPHLMRDHHAVVLAYDQFHSESGVATLALAHGRPLLTTSAGGLGDLIDQSKAGVLIESATVDHVVAAIRTAYALGAENLAQMGRDGKHYLEAQRGWDSVAGMTLDAYQELSKNEMRRIDT